MSNPEESEEATPIRAADRGEIVERQAAIDAASDEEDEPVTEPAKVMRIGQMIKQLLEEVRSAELDESSRERLRDIYDTSIAELSTTLSEDLREELSRLALPFDDDEAPSAAELRVAKAQLVGWLEGLFHGIQATLVAQQMAARAQLDEMRQQLPAGSPQPPPGAGGAGTYL